MPPGEQHVLAGFSTTSGEPGVTVEGVYAALRETKTHQGPWYVNSLLTPEQFRIEGVPYTCDDSAPEPKLMDAFGTMQTIIEAPGGRCLRVEGWLASLSESLPTAAQPLPEGTRHAIDLLQAWCGVDTEEQRETWTYLKAALDEDRLSDRKLFP